MSKSEIEKIKVVENYIRADLKSDTIVLYNKQNGNYALLLHSFFRCRDFMGSTRIWLWPFVVDTGYSVEVITTKEEFRERYECIGVL